jgi:putative SOS response-associated peptidase YedK
MCGRLVLTRPREALELAFSDVETGAGEIVEDSPSLLDDPAIAALAPRYNIAPSQPVLAVARGRGGVRRAVHFLWGMVPSWSRDPMSGPRPINARSESAADKPTFRAALERRRCLIPVDGFYEWQTTASATAGSGRFKQPWLFFSGSFEDRRPFMIAGLWEHYKAPDGSELLTCALLTTAANADMADIHDRLPVIISPDHYTLWLDGEAGRKAVAGLLRPGPEGFLSRRAVGRAVNSAGHEGPDCFSPPQAEGDTLPAPRRRKESDSGDDRQASLF